MGWSPDYEADFIKHIFSCCADHINESEAKSKLGVGSFTREYRKTIFGGKRLQKDVLGGLSSTNKECLKQYTHLCQKYNLNYKIVEEIDSEIIRDPFITQWVNVYIEYSIDNPLKYLHKVFEDKEKAGDAYKDLFQDLDIVNEFAGAVCKYYFEKVNALKSKYESYSKNSNAVQHKLVVLIDNRHISVDPYGDLNFGELELNFGKSGYENLENEQMRMGMFLTIFEKFSRLVKFDTIWIPNFSHWPRKDDDSVFTVFVSNPTNPNKKLKPWF